MVPVASQVRFVVGDHDQMKDAGEDAQATTGADVLLASRIRLYRGDCHPEKIAHATTTTIATRATTIAAISATFFS
jgi:hypothetical protein